MRTFPGIPSILSNFGLTCASSYAGWIGTIAARYTIGTSKKLSPPVSLKDSKHRLAVVAGTSTCHVIQVSLSSPITSIPYDIDLKGQNPEGIFVPGVWGPYKVR